MTLEGEPRVGSKACFVVNRVVSPRSLAYRLSLLFAFLAAILLSGLAAGTYWALDREFLMDENRMLGDTTTLLQTILSKNDDLLATLHQELPRDLEAFHFHRYQLEILDSQGQSLYRSAHFPEMPEFLKAQMVSAPEGLVGTGTPLLTGGDSYLVLRSQAQSKRGESLTLWLALDTSQKTRTLGTYSRVLGLMVLGGVALAALISRAVARQGLRPLELMARQISRLSSARLSQRLSRSTWPAELQPLAQAFDQLLDEVEEGMERISGFSLDIAHELRNPLTSLRLEAEIALSQPRSEDEYREVLTSGLEELERISQLVERLLLVARTETADQHLQTEEVAVREWVEGLVEFAFGGQSDRVVLEIAEDARVTADPALFELALSNLLSNAQKHGLPPFRVTYRQEDGVSVLAVSNGGPPIPAQHLPLIFERLYRVDPSRSQTSGYGLGLALVRSAMRAHGGEAAVTSEPGETRFELRFPRTPQGVLEPLPGRNS